MSYKKTTTKYEEPIKLDTTILKINVLTKGDLITKDYDPIPFHPNMADIKDLSNNNYIFFPTFEKITKTDLSRAKLGDNKLKMFTSLDYYLQLVKYIASPDRETDNSLLVDQSKAKQYALSVLEDITGDVVNDFVTVQKEETMEEGLTDEEIITNNIGLIKSIFFPNRGRFYVLGREYIIGKSKYIPPYTAGNEINKVLEEKHKVPLVYTITIELELLDATNNPNAGDFSRLSCRAKKESIKADLVGLFGTKFKFEEKINKAVLPSLLKLSPEITERGYGKLQKDWEERNKYMPPPRNEEERLAQESKKTALQKKMSKLEKEQLEYNKIPPLWIKERNALKVKYDEYQKELAKYKKEIADIENNKVEGVESFTDDLIKAVTDKMALATRNLIIATEINKIQAFDLSITQATYDKTYLDSITSPEIKQQIQDKITEYTKLKDTNNVERLNDLALQISVLKLMDAIIKKLKEKPYTSTEIETLLKKEQEIINAKYVAPFLEDLKEKQKEVDFLTKDVNTMKAELTKQPNIYKDQELKKIQQKLFNAQVSFNVLKDKYGDNGKKLVGDGNVKGEWEKALEKMTSIKDSIEVEKNLDARKIENENVNKELKAKFEEIEKVKKDLLVASFYAGEDKELTKSEKESYGSKSKPLESYDNLKNNLESLETEYLEIARKLGIEREIQAKIFLLTSDLDRIKTLKEKKREELKRKEEENTSKLNLKNKILNPYGTNVNKDISEQDKKQIAELEKERSPILHDIELIKQTLDIIEKKKKLYETFIDELKRIKDKDKYVKIVDQFNEFKLKALENYSRDIYGLNVTKESDDFKDKVEKKKQEENKAEINFLAANQGKKYDKKTTEKIEEEVKNELMEEEKKKFEKKYNDAITLTSGGGGNKRTHRKHKKTHRKHKKTHRKHKKRHLQRKTYKKFKTYLRRKTHRN